MISLRSFYGKSFLQSGEEILECVFLYFMIKFLSEEKTNDELNCIHWPRYPEERKTEPLI